MKLKDRKGIKMKQQKIIIRNWIIFTEFGVGAIPYILDSSKLDVTEEELSLCIREQIYGVMK